MVRSWFCVLCLFLDTTAYIYVGQLETAHNGYMSQKCDL